MLDTSTKFSGQCNCGAFYGVFPYLEVYVVWCLPHICQFQSGLGWHRIYPVRLCALHQLKLKEDLASLQATVDQLNAKLETCKKKLESMKRELDEKESLMIEYCNKLQVILLSQVLLLLSGVVMQKLLISIRTNFCRIFMFYYKLV